MEKIYRATDGKIFEGKTAEKDCIAYEKQLEEKELTRKEMHKAVEQAKLNYENKIKEMQEAYGDYQASMSDFCKKYGHYHTRVTVEDLSLFDYLKNIFTL